MITGFQLDVSSDELKNHLQIKADYHKGKAESYGRQLEGVTKLMSDEPNAGLGQTVNADTGLHNQYRSHAQRASFFKFCADHILPNETYRLTEENLIKLEFVERFF